MRKQSTYLLCLFLLSFLTSTSAQTKYIFELLTEESKANFGDAHNICQDSAGIIWLGVFGKGLAYYNGKKVQRTLIKDEEEFSNRMDLFAEGEGFLYLNYGDKIKVFDPIEQIIIDSIFVKNKDKNQYELDRLLFIKKENKEIIYAIREEQKKDAKIEETNYDVLASINRDSFVKITPQPIATHGETFLKNIDNHVLIKNENGFLKLNEEGNILKKYPLPDGDMVGHNEYNVEVDDKGDIWFSGHCFEIEEYVKSCEGIYYWPKNKDSLILYKAENKNYYGLTNPEGRIKNIYKIGDEIWMNHSNRYLLNEQRLAEVKLLSLHENKKLSPGNYQDHFIDDKETIWIASNNGISKLTQQPDEFRWLPPISLRGFAEDEKGLIYGGLEKWVLHKEEEGKNFISVYDPSTNMVNYRRLEVGPTFLLWFNAYYHNGFIHFGKSRYDVKNHRLIPVSQNSEELGSGPISLVDRDLNIWRTGWYNDFILLSDLGSMDLIKKISIPALSEKKVQLNDLYQRPSDGTVWLGSYGEGVFIFPKGGGTPLQLSRSKDSPLVLNNNIVAGFYENKKGEMWLGHGSGLSRISPDFKTIKHFAIDEERPEFYLVYTIVPEKNDRFLWLSTNQGVFRYDTEKEEVMDFPLNPFLMRTEFNRNSFFKGKNSQVYFGRSTFDRETLSFFPKEVVEFYEHPALSKANIILTEYSQYDNETEKVISKNSGLQAMNEIILNPGDRYFTLEYTTSDFLSPANNYYSYYLEGYENDWNKVERNNNKIRYENLPPGKYTLKMRGALMKNNITLNERKIKITVLPFWYQTWWSKILFGIIVGTGFYLFYKFRLKRQMEMQEAIRLRDLDNLKTRLYTNITHEFRTPLTVIMGMNDNIQGHKQERNLIRRNAKNLLRLINQLLDLSKLDSGTLKMDAVQGDIIGYLHYLTESFYSMATDKKVNLRFLPTIKSLVMDFDEVKIQHVVYNLLSNAIKFTRPGGKVSLETSEMTRNGKPHLKIKVRDTGIGIPERDLPHIFDRFYQVEKSASPIADSTSSAVSNKTFAGTGIGLALTKELIELMGGTIAVKSELEWGTEFTVMLPVQQNISTPKMEAEFEAEYSENELIPDFAALPVKPDQINGKKPQVLVVEDNAGVVTYIKSLLENEYYVQVAINGQEGIDMALECIPDLIITDVMMPEKNGYEVCLELKEDKRTSHVPIIMLTAKADLDSKLEGLEKGADVYLSKPFNKKELLLRVKKLMELRQKLQQHYLSVAGIEEVPVQEEAIAAPEDEFVKKAREVVEENLANYEFKVEMFCRELTMSHSQLHRKLKALTGLSASKFIRSIRLAKAKEMMRDPDLPLANIAYDTGFNDPNYFSRIFKQEFGLSPSEWREQQ